MQRGDCAPALAPWVENYWALGWSMPAGQHHLSQTLPHPAVSLSVERGTTRPEIGDDPVAVTGVPTRRFDVDIHGDGWVFGVKFRPGGFAAMFGTPGNALRDRVVPAAGLVPDRVRAELAGLGPTLDFADCTARADQSLAAVRPRPDSEYDLVREVIAQMLADRTLLRVAEVEQRIGIGRRTLQRLFARYVGVSTKWVLARYRMHDVLTALDDGYDGLLTDLATAYGWYDQAHFIRDFTALVGTSPGEYRRVTTDA